MTFDSIRPARREPKDVIAAVAMSLAAITKLG